MSKSKAYKMNSLHAFIAVPLARFMEDKVFMKKFLTEDWLKLNGFSRKSGCFGKGMSNGG